MYSMEYKIKTFSILIVSVALLISGVTFIFAEPLPGKLTSSKDSQPKIIVRNLESGKRKEIRLAGSHPFSYKGLEFRPYTVYDSFVLRVSGEDFKKVYRLPSKFLSKANKKKFTLYRGGTNQRFEVKIKNLDKSDIKSLSREKRASRESQSYILELKSEPLLPKKIEYRKKFLRKKNKIEKYIQDLEEIRKKLKDGIRSQKLKEVSENLTEIKKNFGISSQVRVKEKKTTSKSVSSLIKSLEGEKIEVRENYRSDVQNYREKLGRIHSKVVKNIEEIQNKSKRGATSSKHFRLVFNGLQRNLTGSEIEEVRELDRVERVWKDRKVRSLLNGTVDLMGASELWKRQVGGTNITGKNITIAIIDTGVDYTHPDLGNCTKSEFLNGNCEKVIGGYDVYNYDENPMDDHGHGTHCAGIAAGNGSTVKGVAPGAKVLAYKVLSSGGSGSWSDVIGGIERAVNNNADVISLSLGGSGNPDDPISQAVDNAVKNGAVAAVAAGNSGSGYQTVDSPGTARKAITVGATNNNDELASFSSRGPVTWRNGTLVKPSLAAPGVEVCSAQWDNAWSGSECIDDKHTSISGTSMATPHVAGLAALLEQAHPEWSPGEIKSAMTLGAKDLNYEVVEEGSGRVNATASENISILTSPTSLHHRFSGTKLTHSLNLTIKNLRSQGLELNLTIENATTTSGENASIAQFNYLKKSITTTIPANSRRTLNFTLNMTGSGGTYYGKVKIDITNTSYEENMAVPYIGTFLARLNVSAVGRDLYPDFYLHSNDMSVKKSASQVTDFYGNSYTFELPPDKNYTVYGIGDDYNTSLEYILSNQVTDFNSAGGNITLNISKAKEFNVMAESISGEPLVLYKWEKAIKTYNYPESYWGISYIDPTKGNRTVYVSEKPKNGLQTDILFRYKGVP